MVPLMKTDDYNDKSVTTEKLADKSVTDKKVADNAISTANIKDYSIITSKIANKSITTEKLTDKSVTTDKLADGAVTNAKLAPDSVNAFVISDQSILSSHFSQGAWEAMNLAYLRLDGNGEGMRGNLNLNHHSIERVDTINSDYQGLGSSVILGGNGYDICFKWVGADSDEVSTYLLGGLSRGIADFHESGLIAKSFKTADRTSIGLLANDGSVGLAMTDSEIDAIASQVFSSYE